MSRYRLLGTLGRGGYAEVFRAQVRDEPGAIVALKRPLPRVDGARERMEREIRVQRQLKHDNIMPILDAADDSSWFVMPLAEGNLEQLRSAWGLGDDPEEVASVLRAISAGLQYAHEHGFIHRDISPRNILALPDEESSRPRWVVADWGLVRRAPGQTTRRLTSVHEGLGTEGFAAPETSEAGHDADVTADVYSLGRVTAWLHTGTWPRPNRPLRPEGPLRGLVHECTEDDPLHRIQSMQAFRERLSELLARPPLSPRGEAQALVEQAISGSQNEAQVAAIARAHPEDAALYLDELARLPMDAIERLAHSSPENSAALAETMLEHLDSPAFGHRDFNYANVPLRWAFTVLEMLTRDGQHGLAEDLATTFFRVDKQWNRFRQVPITVHWLRSLDETDGAPIARAMRRAGAHSYYESGVAEGLRSRSLAAEFGQ